MIAPATDIILNYFVSKSQTFKLQALLHRCTFVQTTILITTTTIKTPTQPTLPITMMTTLTINLEINQTPHCHMEYTLIDNGSQLVVSSSSLDI